MDSCWNETIKVCPEGDGEAPLWKVPCRILTALFGKTDFRWNRPLIDFSFMRTD